ncbi:hypothetical protein DB30_04645 [Enhygromyxa salina]|uniref:Uncharacterized protein n=1 Tax=Enhygromyxa salina TaxID=215803 RepID=A0A0C2DCN2_9BACT|nr:hypothetical protein [Enhygromyxa salina]KIG19180.1 hypothetical protein DB30_04645 [Enhygromyxa salina]
MRTLIFASCLVPLLLGCKDTPKPPSKIVAQEAKPARKKRAKPKQPPPTGVHVEIRNAKNRECQRTLCIAGPGELYSESNRDLGELCARGRGVVQRCEGERCDNVWAVEMWREGLAGLISSLDRNGDGKLDSGDPPCAINLAGWSTGGVVVSQDLPIALADDPNVDAAHAKIQHLVAITPYSNAFGPESKGEPLEIPDNVGKAFIYRHTKSPPDDCSAAFEEGPWRSPAPACGEQTTCFDYDYSQEPELAYLGRRGARSGAMVGHCNVVALVAKIGLDNLIRGEESFQQLLPPYSDGTQGGRIFEGGPDKPDPIVVLPNPIEPD